MTKRRIPDLLQKKPAEKEEALSPEMRHLILEAQHVQHVKRLQSDGDESHKQEPSRG